MTLGRVAALVVALLVVAGLGGTVRAAQEAAASSDEDLVDRLVAIEDRAASVPVFPTVTVSVDETFGTLSGDFVGARATLDLVSDDLTELVAAASDADSEVADAVAAVATAYRTMHEGYAFLEEYERSILVGPAVDDVSDEDGGTAVVDGGGDEARGPAESGLVLLLDALPGFHQGYGVLRDAEAAAEVRSLFELRFQEVQTAARTDGEAAQLALSLPSTDLLVPVSRFDPAGADGDRARTVRYACVERDDYLAARSFDATEEATLPDEDRNGLLFTDCPGLTTDTLVVEAPAGG
ncbi:MAG: hypothetical protein ACRDUY_07875 [Nitriliruptorales bacterium]